MNKHFLKEIKFKAHDFIVTKNMLTQGKKNNLL
jgi:hypothetical protein